MSKEIINFYDSVYDKAVSDTFTNKEKAEAAATVLKAFHETVGTFISALVTNVQSIYVKVNGKYIQYLFP